MNTSLCVLPGKSLLQLLGSSITGPKSVPVSQMHVFYFHHWPAAKLILHWTPDWTPEQITQNILWIACTFFSGTKTSRWREQWISEESNC